MTNVCLFRLDDITPDMDWNKFYRVKAIFDKYKVKPLVGVVPDNGDPGLRRGEYHKDFWEYIASLEQSGWQVAQHGYRHIYETKHAGMLGLKKASEFAGLPYEVQYEKIREGREILKRNGLHAPVFMAPGHTYDRNTLKALRKLDFTCVTDGYANIPYRKKGLLFVPCRSSRPKLSGGVDTICIHCNELRENDYLKIQMQERRNLLLHRLRKFVAESPVLQVYLQETWDEDRARKRRKRIWGLWRLLPFRKREQQGRENRRR